METDTRTPQEITASYLAHRSSEPLTWRAGSGKLYPGLRVHQNSRTVLIYLDTPTPDRQGHVLAITIGGVMILSHGAFDHDYLCQLAQGRYTFILTADNLTFNRISELLDLYLVDQYSLTSAIDQWTPHH